MSWRGLQIQVELSCQAMDDKIIQFRQQCAEQQVALYCEKGCRSCCTLAVSCSFPEAATLVSRMTPQQKQQLLATLPELENLSRNAENLKDFLKLYRDRCGACVLLSDEGNCTVYEYRPLSCRALLSTRPADWCAVDFSTLHPLEKKAFISSLDPQIVAFPSHYLAASQDEGAALQNAICTTMVKKYGFYLTGNLLWLLGLELKHQLSQALDTDSQQIRAWLDEQQQLYPYLMEVETETQPLADCC